MAYKETINRKAEFNYLHKKQSGGSGQFARVVGYIEPCDDDDEDAKEGDEGFVFVNECVGTNIPPEFISSCEKGARDAMAQGALTGSPMKNVKVVVLDGQVKRLLFCSVFLRVCVWFVVSSDH